MNSDDKSEGVSPRITYSLVDRRGEKMQTRRVAICHHSIAAFKIRFIVSSFRMLSHGEAREDAKRVEWVQPKTGYLERSHSHRVGLLGRARGDAEEARLRVDRVQTTVLFGELHPCDVVSCIYIDYVGIQIGRKREPSIPRFSRNIQLESDNKQNSEVDIFYRFGDYH